MGLTQLCEICLQVEAEEECRLCGRSVCKKHFDREQGLCAACRETLCEICGRKLSMGYCVTCGRLVCEDCSVKENLALVCINCSRRQEV
uniref:B box-type domain-containing protein n=1 Tax=Thermofilum pendens TaxID=2269 RepID=A0A7C3WPS0_THEPE